MPFRNALRSGSGRAMSRRDCLRCAALIGLELSPLPIRIGQAASTVSPGTGFGRAKSVVVVFMNGGQSQIDIWDPKPLAPLDVRGAFRPIATRVSGIQFCEHLPQTALVADRLALVRSMSHEDLDHGTAVYLALTGCYHPIRSGNPPPSVNDMPTFGAILRRIRSAQQNPSVSGSEPGPRGENLQSSFRSHEALHLNGPALVPTEPSPGQNGGFLGRAYEPLVVGEVGPEQETIPGLALHADWPPPRLGTRLALKQLLDRHSGLLSESQRAVELGHWYSQAFATLDSPRARQAFQIERESDRTRERYGHHRSGRALLLARRLVEAGVPYINVIWNHSNRGQDQEAADTDLYGWDTHNDIFTSLRQRLLPRFDQSFSAFVEDLDQRGLLDETLVICMGEFGRAPRVAVERNFAGSAPGRKHWAAAYSMVAAGAGVQRGAVIGATDRMGAEPVSERYGPWDVAATLFHALGIDPQQHYSDLSGRTFPIARGRPMERLYSG